ncbi:glycerophosphodiester phosphodiesterase [Anaeramoeba flamelloides]|uniref:Glycerophosphodiester phosphodiesterase n=1 Tax=Anaeramoeba flamelloides TaxID=1746091 RepID=A0ABQ8XKI0_9EUKA|nr:glycerophosphodiester phosphodiesterase [Anaeramoeba flamelloides]
MKLVVQNFTYLILFSLIVNLSLQLEFDVSCDKPGKIKFITDKPELVDCISIDSGMDFIQFESNDIEYNYYYGDYYFTPLAENCLGKPLSPPVPCHVKLDEVKLECSGKINSILCSINSNGYNPRNSKVTITEVDTNKLIQTINDVDLPILFLNLDSKKRYLIELTLMIDKGETNGDVDDLLNNYPEELIRYITNNEVEITLSKTTLSPNAFSPSIVIQSPNILSIDPSQQNSEIKIPIEIMDPITEQISCGEHHIDIQVNKGEIKLKIGKVLNNLLNWEILTNQRIKFWGSWGLVKQVLNNLYFVYNGKLGINEDFEMKTLKSSGIYGPLGPPNANKYSTDSDSILQNDFGNLNKEFKENAPKNGQEMDNVDALAGDNPILLEIEVTNRKLNIFGHGGSERIFPVNTFQSFKDALPFVTGIETDLHILKDNTILCIHNAPKTPKMKIKDIWCQNDFKNFEHLSVHGYKIPKIEDLLELVCNKKRYIFLDIKQSKCKSERVYAVHILKYIDRLNCDHKQIILNGDPWVIKELNELSPNFAKTILKISNNTIGNLKENIDQGLANGVTITSSALLTFTPDDRTLQNSCFNKPIQKFHKDGSWLHTHDGGKELHDEARKKLLNLEIDSINSMRPDKLIQFMQQDHYRSFNQYGYKIITLNIDSIDKDANRGEDDKCSDADLDLDNNGNGNDNGNLDENQKNYKQNTPKTKTIEYKSNKLLIFFFILPIIFFFLKMFQNISSSRNSY